MMKELIISSVEKRKNSKGYKIHIDDETYNISETMLIKHHLFKGEKFTEDKFSIIKTEIYKDELLNKVLEYLSFGSRSEFEVHDYLKKIIFKRKIVINNQDIIYIINYLKEHNYLNDEHFAKQLLRYYKDNYKGPKYIESKLKEKHISHEIINAVLKDYLEIEEIENINHILLIQKDRLSNYPINKQKQLLHSRLINSGFKSNLIVLEMNKLNLIDESDKTLEKDFSRIFQKVNQKQISDYEKKQLIINHLMNKGYEYRRISELLKQ